MIRILVTTTLCLPRKFQGLLVIRDEVHKKMPPNIEPLPSMNAREMPKLLNWK